MRALLLRSPLHRLVSRRWLLLRIDAEQRLLRYHRDGERVTVLGPDGERWWRSLRHDEATPVAVRLQGRWRQGAAHLAAGEELDQAMIGYLHANPGAWQTLGVAPAASPGDVGEAAAAQAVILIDLT